MKNRSKNCLNLYSRGLFYLKAWRSDDKVVVIESDDWGSIRTSTREAYDHLERQGYQMSASKYSLDALETNQDLVELFNVLGNYFDADGNPACMTANMIMTNPDFNKIKENNFSEYFYENVWETLKNYPDRELVTKLWREGLKNRVFFPQLHARDHVRYWEWIRDLRLQKREAHDTFGFGMCGVPRKCSKSSTSYYLPIYVDSSILHKVNVDQQGLISEGFRFFKNGFGYESKSVVAPGCGWTATTEDIWAENGVKYIQGGFLQEHHYNNEVRYIPHYLGESAINKRSTYLVRNCLFEPANSEDENYWRSTLRQVERAFYLKTPAIISSHRVNYIGSIFRKNREHSLSQLNLLLFEIIKRWPDVKFLTSVQLGDRIIASQNKLDYNS